MAYQDKMSSSSNQPEAFPLQRVSPKYDFKLTEPNALLSDIWLAKERGESTARTPLDISASGINTRKRRTFGEEEESTGTESCDDMLASDTDTNSMVSANGGSVLASFRENRVNHPPKRRLTANDSVNESIVSSIGMSGGVSRAASTSSITSALIPGNPGIGGLSGAIIGAATSSEVVAPRTPTAFNSPSDSPMSDGQDTPDDEDNATIAGGTNTGGDAMQSQLPLPSPSASPELSYNKELTPILTDYQLVPLNVPTTQAELLSMIMGLSTYLNEKNHNHVIFKLLQNVRRTTLLSLNDVIRTSLKRDLISNLPLEITYNILKKLDYKTVSTLSSVCSNWNKIINSTGIWTDLLKLDKLVSGDEEIEREIKQVADLRKWSTVSAQEPLGSINLAQLLYKKRRIILSRWMDPKYEPKRISVPGHGSNVVTCLQHDDDKIITGVDDKLINIYSTKTGKLLRVLKGHDGGVWALKYTGNTLVSGSTDRTVRVWNIKTGKCTQVFRGHTSTVRCLDILHPTKIGTDVNGEDIIFPETPLLVTGSRDHNLHVWKLPLVDEGDDGDDEMTDQPIEVDASSSSNLGENPYLVAILSGHTHSVRSVSGFGNIIISGSYDTTVRVWDLLDRGKCKYILAGHQDKIYSTALDFQNKRCYSGSMDATINVWDFEKGKLLYTLEGHGSLVGLLELSNEYLVSAAADATLRVWNPESGRNLSKLEGHSAAITCFQHDNLRIVSGSEKMLKLWDIKTGKFVRDLLADITGGIWQVRFDYCRCVAAVQRNRNDNDETFIEIVDFSSPPIQQNQITN